MEKEMLKLKNITKDYVSSSETVKALKGVNVCFRQKEFVSVLGPSGCGKTTLLNIIGGLDHYTDGDLVIGGKSTKLYSDRDWDVYRNHRVGFIFQSYNLIPHQTVLGNVELALTIAGIMASWSTIPGRAVTNAAVKNMPNAKLPPKARKRSADATPQTILPASIAITSAIYAAPMLLFLNIE